MCEGLSTYVDKKRRNLCGLPATEWADEVRKRKLIDIGFAYGSSMDKGNHVMDGLTRG